MMSPTVIVVAIVTALAAAIIASIVFAPDFQANKCSNGNYTYKVKTYDTTYYTNNITLRDYGLVSLHGYCLWSTFHNSTAQVLAQSIITDY